MPTPPRRTDNVTPLDHTDRSLAEARARLARTGGMHPIGESFRWPSPPYFEYAPGRGPKHIEECLLVFRDGTKTTGRLLQFVPDELQLKFQASDAGTAVTVSFTNLVLMQLLRAVRLRPQG